MTSTNHLHTVRGFTLIETLLAIFILTMSIAGPLTIAARGLGSALIAKDQTTAFYLAQDAVEYVRFARDTNCLGASTQSTNNQCPVASWLSGTINLTPCTGANGCYLDSLSNSPQVPTVCAAAGCAGTPLYLDPSNDNYDYNSGGTRSIFTRSVTITTPATNSGEASVTVTVSWQDTGGTTHKVITREDLYDWE